jgi:hypothetical protein
MLKDIIEEYTTKLEENWTTVGPKEIITETAQIVAREVLRLVKDKVELERFSAWSPNDPTLELISKGSKDTADAVLIYLQSLEKELSAEVLPDQSNDEEINIPGFEGTREDLKNINI